MNHKNCKEEYEFYQRILKDSVLTGDSAKRFTYLHLIKDTIELECIPCDKLVMPNLKGLKISIETE